MGPGGQGHCGKPHTSALGEAPICLAVERMKIIIGPFFSRATPQVDTPSRQQPGIAPLRIALEWSSPEEAHCVPIFVLDAPQGLRLRQILARASDLPRDVICPDLHVLETQEGTFVPLEGLLSSLYQAGESGRPIREVLGELASIVPLRDTVRGAILDEGLLVPAAEAQGFRIIKGLREGEEILLSLGWAPQGLNSLFHVVTCRFWVQQGKLDAGEWIKAQGAPGISQALAVELAQILPGAPNRLLSAAGLDYVNSLQSAT